jgi:hypothetical protein
VNILACIEAGMLRNVVGVLGYQIVVVGLGHAQSRWTVDESKGFALRSRLGLQGQEIVGQGSLIKTRFAAQILIVNRVQHVRHSDAQQIWVHEGSHRLQDFEVPVLRLRAGVPPLGNIQGPLVEIGALDGLTIFHIAHSKCKAIISGLTTQIRSGHYIAHRHNARSTSLLLRPGHRIRSASRSNHFCALETIEQIGKGPRIEIGILVKGVHLPSGNTVDLIEP